MAAALGEANAHEIQWLLEEAEWDEEAVRDELRSDVIEHVGEPTGLLVADETGVLTKGKMSAGVARHTVEQPDGESIARSGCFSRTRVPKEQHSLIALSLPDEWTQDRVRCREAGIPDAEAFATKGELARQMLARAFAAEVPAWVVADRVYGYDELRGWRRSGSGTFWPCS
jgi:SRSO17 transposase